MKRVFETQKKSKLIWSFNVIEKRLSLKAVSSRLDSTSIDHFFRVFIAIKINYATNTSSFPLLWSFWRGLCKLKARICCCYDQVKPFSDNTLETYNGAARIEHCTENSAVWIFLYSLRLLIADHFWNSLLTLVPKSGRLMTGSQGGLVSELQLCTFEKWLINWRLKCYRVKRVILDRSSGFGGSEAIDFETSPVRAWI